MSVFTMSLQEVVELHGRDNIGLDTYPVLGENYRARLNNLIIEEYWQREIGFETVSLWRQRMRLKMAQIMPYYNQLYRTETLIVDPLQTVNLKTLTVDDRSGVNKSDTAVESSGTNETQTTSKSTARNVSSETPQVFLSDNGNYATAAADSNSGATAGNKGSESVKADTKVEGNTTSHDVMDSTTTGFQGSQAQLIADFRATILNIDMQIVNEVESLFMGIFNNGNTYTPNWRY